MLPGLHGRSHRKKRSLLFPASLLSSLPGPTGISRSALPLIRQQEPDLRNRWRLFVCPEFLTRPTRLPRHAVCVSTSQSKPVRPLYRGVPRAAFQPPQQQEKNSPDFPRAQATPWNPSKNGTRYRCSRPSAMEAGPDPHPPLAGLHRRHPAASRGIQASRGGGEASSNPSMQMSSAGDAPPA